MSKQIRLQIPEKLGTIFQGDADYRGAYGGRGAAKTIGFGKMAIKEVMMPSDEPWIFLCGRELQKSLKDSVFSVIASQIIEMGVQDAFEVGRNFIRCKNGNEFLFYGLRSNIAEVKGLHGVRRTWLEEAQSVSETSLTYLIPTVMRDFPDCEMWASWNPDDEDDPIHKMFVTNADESVKCVKINWNDNPWFPDSLNKVRLRDKKNRPDRYDWIWNGMFNLNNEAAVYGKWLQKLESTGRHRTGIYDPDLPVHTAWDIGHSDDTAIWFWQVAGQEIRLIDYYANNREDIRHYLEQVYGKEIIVLERHLENGSVLKWEFGADIEEAKHRQKYNLGSHYGPHDMANKLFAAGGRSAIQQARDLGTLIHPVAAVGQQMQIDIGRQTLDICYIDENAHTKEGVRCIRKYEFSYDDDKKKYSKEPIHNWASHGCDAFEIIGQVWRLPREDKPEKGKTMNNMSLNDLWATQKQVKQRI